MENYIFVPNVDQGVGERKVSSCTKWKDFN